MSKKKKPLTPIEMFEYKKSWQNTYKVQVDTDAYVWAVTFCKTHFANLSWYPEKHSLPDDSHTFLFEKLSDSQQFSIQYQQKNPRFDVNSYQSNTNKQS